MLKCVAGRAAVIACSLWSLRVYFPCIAEVNCIVEFIAGLRKQQLVRLWTYWNLISGYMHMTILTVKLIGIFLIRHFET